jgi:hypothetical protein
MPKLRKHQSTQRTKMLLVGDNGTGKTSALAGLVKSGQRLFIADFDNGLDPLLDLLTDEEKDRVVFETLKDPLSLKGGQPTLAGRKPKAWPRFSKLLERWKDDEEDYGGIEDWGPETTLVVDSLTYQGHAALWKVLADKKRLGKPKRIQDWGDAIELQETAIALVTDERVKCNVVLTAHLAQLTQDEDEEEDNPSPKNQKRYPTVLGKKLPPRVGSYFNTVCMTKTKGAGSKVRRVVKTTPDPDVDVKVPAIETDLPGELPVKDALPTIFNTLQGKGNSSN